MSRDETEKAKVVKSTAEKEAEAKVKADKKAREDAKYAPYINPKAFAEHTKEEFMEQTKGKLPFDCAQAWEWVKANRK